MATKTVINTKMPETRGISIIIDQDQQQVVNCKQQQQQQQQPYPQQLEASKIVIYQNTMPNTKTTNTITATSSTNAELIGEIRSLEKVVALQDLLSPEKSPAILKTFIDINCNNNVINAYKDNEVQYDKYNYDNKLHNDNNNNEQHVEQMKKETGCNTTTITTTKIITKEATTPLQLRVSSNDPLTTESRKLSEQNVENLQISMQTNTSTSTYPTHTYTYEIKESSSGENSINNIVGVSLTTNEQLEQESNGTNDMANDVLTSKKMIIKCNNEHQNAQQHHSTNDASNDVNSGDYVESQTKQNEESLQLSIGSSALLVGDSENGKLSYIGVCSVDSQKQPQPHIEQQQHQPEQLESANGLQCPDSLTTKADCVSALTTEKDSHVVKIQIKPNLLETVNANKVLTNILDTEHTVKLEKQVTVVKLNDIVSENKNFITAIEAASKSDLDLNLDKMVQKPTVTSNIGTHAQNSSASVGGITSGNTTVTELNVSNPTYLYYMMSSGQFSPCDTLDSGTGSDLESNGNSSTITLTANSSKLVAATNNCVVVDDATPKIEMHLKTTKIRVTKDAKCKDKQNGTAASEHQRAGSLTDSEESESSLSCDSLHSTEFMRQTSVSPTGKATNAKMLATFLPDSLLRDIRDRKFPTNDFESKYGNNSASMESINEQDYIEIQNAVERLQQQQQQQEQNVITSSSANTADLSNGKRASLPNKTFILNTDEGTFVDTKMNSMPRKYEADKYYNFHVHEHENFRSFGNGNGIGNANVNGNGCLSLTDDASSLLEYETKNANDDAFAGYKDIRCGSATSTIRSSKGTVRGVKNRVRNGIATFLQLQQPNVKNYKEKDFGKVVLYTTSMGIIRDTYAKCSNVKQILRTLLVKFEERDVFMSVEYQQEIKERMHSEAIKVPQLFVEGQHIGDADTVERLNESGELRQLLKPYKSIATMYTCQTCGGYRLLPCPSCNGSKKSVHRNHFTAEFVALKCMNCDEVGLVKCHNC